MKSFKDMYSEEELQKMKAETEQKFQNITFADIVRAIEFKLEEINPKTAQDMIRELSGVVTRYNSSQGDRINNESQDYDDILTPISIFNKDIQYGQ